MRGRLGDGLSVCLFEGRLSFLRERDDSVLGDMVRRYYEAAPDAVRRESGELFSVLRERARACDEHKRIVFAASSHAELRQMRFMRGFGADIFAACCLDDTLLAERQSHDPPFLSIEQTLAQKKPLALPPLARGRLEALLDAGLDEGLVLSAEAFPLNSFTDIAGCYFDGGLIDFTNQSFFVDGGALDLFSSYRFAQKTKGNYSVIYAFEPDAGSFAACLQNKELFDERLHLSQAALWDCAGTLSFSTDAENSRCERGGETLVAADTLDSLLGGASPTLIKLHLEGAELRALKGAAKTIKRCRPALALTVEHRAEDILEIPLAILDLDSSYRFYLRHYSDGVTETVLYAI